MAMLTLFFNNIIDSRKGDVVALIAGLLLTLAFSPFEHNYLAPVSVGILIFLWENQKPSRAAWRGFLFGIGWFVSGASWIYISIHTFGHTHALVAIIMTALFCFLMAFYPALKGYIVTRYFFLKNGWHYFFYIPAVWVLLEWIRSWFLSGFPWLQIGVSQVDSVLSGIAPIGGVYAVSFFTVLCGSAIVFMFQSRQTRLTLLTLFFIFITCLVFKQIHWTRPTGKAINVSLLQGNIAQDAKWDENQLWKILDTYWQLTEKSWGTPLIIWPENAIPMLQSGVQSFISRLDAAAKQHHSTVWVGLPIDDPHRDNTYYNGVLSLGLSTGYYYKRQLVPFGEYLPFERYLRGMINFFSIPMSNFRPGPDKQANLMVAGISLAVLICYESVYLNRVLAMLPDAQLLASVSNDAWFGHSLAPYQHLQINRMRSIETGRFQLIATNDGMTAVIDDKGRIKQALPPFKEGTLQTKVPAMEGATPLIRTGNITPLICFFILFITLLMRWFQR